MPQDMSRRKALGIAGKDTVAAGLAAEGLRRLISGDYVIGAACVGLALALYVIDQYL